MVFTSTVHVNTWITTDFLIQEGRKAEMAWLPYLHTYAENRIQDIKPNHSKKCTCDRHILKKQIWQYCQEM